MDEKLFETGDPQPKPDEGDAKPQEDNARLEALEQSITATNTAVQSLTGRLETIFTEAAAAQEPTTPTLEVKPDADEFLTELATNPAETIDKRAQAVVEKMAEEQLTPTLRTIIETTHDTLLTKHEMEVDKQFGDGVWKEVVHPALEEDLGSLRKVNYRAIADPKAMKALVDRQLGVNWKTLRDKEINKDEEAKKVDEQKTQVASALPAGGQPRIRLSADEPHEDAKLFFSEIKSATGQDTDVKRFMKLHNAGNTIDDYLKVVGETK